MSGGSGNESGGIIHIARCGWARIVAGNDAVIDFDIPRFAAVLIGAGPFCRGERHCIGCPWGKAEKRLRDGSEGLDETNLSAIGGGRIGGGESTAVGGDAGAVVGGATERPRCARRGVLKASDARRLEP